VASHEASSSSPIIPHFQNSKLMIVYPPCKAFFGNGFYPCSVNRNGEYLSTVGMGNEGGVCRDNGGKRLSEVFNLLIWTEVSNANLLSPFRTKVLIGKFEDGRWRKSWVEVPFVEYVHFSLSPLGLRYGGREWAVFQEAGTFRCVAIALERQR
jgi:hypothetical protein